MKRSLTSDLRSWHRFELHKVMEGLSARSSATPFRKEADNVEFKSKLREFVDSWLEVRPDFSRWWKTNPKLASLLDRVIERQRWKIISRPPPLAPHPKLEEARESAERILRAMASEFKAYDGRVPETYTTRVLRGAEDPPARVVPDEDRWRPAEMAAWRFSELVTNPCHRDVHKCACCGDYFLNMTMRAKRTYCSKRCRTQGTARATMKEKRRREQQEKIALTNRLLVRYVEEKRHEPWKLWLVRESRGKLTLNWITRAGHRGDLSLPAS